MLSELRRPRSEPSSYYSSESHKDYPAPKKHKLNPDYFSTRQEKLLSTALSLEQPSGRKPGTKPSLSETISPRHGAQDYAREPAPNLMGYRSTKWGLKETYLGMPGVQVTGSPAGVASGKDSGAQRLHQREQMGVLMMADRDVAELELLSFRGASEGEECLHHMDDLQVGSAGAAGNLLGKPDGIKDSCLGLEGLDSMTSRFPSSPPILSCENRARGLGCGPTGSPCLPQVTMMTLAEHIIEATPERIKQENFVPAEEASQAERTDRAALGTSMSWLAGYLADVDRLPSAAQIRSVVALEGSGLCCLL